MLVSMANRDSSESFAALNKLAVRVISPVRFRRAVKKEFKPNMSQVS
jgi:hypothetical protein